jgi:recombination protein RecT
VTTEIAKQEDTERASGKPKYSQALEKAKARFIEISGGDTRTWDSESIFAMQHICKSEFSINTANRNPMSVQLAMYNAASTGLTLNPANAYAYLVPRDGAIKLEISYKGLIKIATDTGSVEWARAEVVYEKDTFEYNGPAEKPTHKANPFSKDRGEIIGVYCIAKVASGDILTEVMDRDEIEKVRGTSDAWAKKKAGPWAEWFSEMCRKAVIKRAQKTWPYTEKSGRLANAIEIANDSEGGYVIEGQCKREEPDEKAAEWIRRAQAIKHMGEYDPERAKLIEFYGDVSKVPAAVKTAFATAHAEVMPRDEEPAQ